ncbi:hypothetical protein L6452_17723 [Arctium lappa]|uniref:Uncharacterized protein n=1 Tax=Arctium lappa TaxID=4217 RepID=A0ACB9C419_ARCLA|nr:hypothetical protein L6452_17723 [Arctium lappa]
MSLVYSRFLPLRLFPSVDSSSVLLKTHKKFFTSRLLPISVTFGSQYDCVNARESFQDDDVVRCLLWFSWEVAKRLNKAKVLCDLITRQEKEVVDCARHKAVTVEMADIASNYDCPVID